MLHPLQRIGSFARRTPIVWLIGGYYLVLLAVTLLMWSLGIYYLVGRFLWHSGEGRLVQQVSAAWYSEADDDRPRRHRGPLTASARFPLDAGELAQKLSSPYLYIRILSPQGQVLADSGKADDPPAVEPQRLAQLPDTLNSRWRARVSYLATTSREWQVMLLPITQDGELVGAVQVCGWYRPTRDMLEALSGYLVLGWLVACPLALIITIGVARFLAHPMEQLLEATKRVRSGDLAARTGLQSGTNEVYAVAEAFDRMVEQLQETFTRQRRFVADASHELKTPLTAISGMAEMLKVGADRGDPERRKLALNTIEKEVDRMSTLVADLLTLSRAEPARPQVSARVDLAALAREAVSNGRLHNRNNQFDCSTTGPVWVLGDGDALARVLRNLVDNAVHYSPEASRIGIVCSVQGDWAQLEVNDEGCGISQDDLPHIFERFYRADRSRTRKTGGSGLGLAIVKSIVEQHGGRVAATSQPGQGTSFRLLLPGAQGHE